MLTESKRLLDPALDKNVSIAVEGISVRYRVPHERVSGIKEYAIRWAQRRLRYEEFWALSEVSFDVRRGEIFGVIGRNGSGKSTLLKVIARVLVPTQGRVFLRGQISPLLELGAGFHPELTGRENVYFNSAMLGRTRKEVDALLPEIIDFAEIGDFIDAPLRTYSTGMGARLGFAVATAVRPEVLLVDEVLSVGDAPFQKKCLDRMYSYQEEGTTVVIVSHGMATIESFCSRALWLDHGHMQALGNVEEVVRQYVQRGNPQESTVFVVPEVPAVEAPPVEAPVASPEEIPPPGPEPASPPVEPPPAPVVAVPAQAVPGKTPDYVSLPQVEAFYPASGIFNVQHGAVSFWLKFRSDKPTGLAILFHSDDSRYVVYAMADTSTPDQAVRQITARAGGNRRVIDTFYGDARFPEASLSLDEGEFPLDEWRLVCLTWSGHPEGAARLYLGERLVAEFGYDRRHDNRFRLPVQLAVGIRPREWVGELVQSEDGTLVELRPGDTHHISAAGQEIADMRLYHRVLTAEDLRALLAEPPA